MAAYNAAEHTASSRNTPLPLVLSAIFAAHDTSGKACNTNSMTKSKEKTLQSADAALIVDIDFDKRRSHKAILNSLNELKCVSYVEEN